VFYLDLTNFQIRDNMLRESSIAQVHWQSVLKTVIEEERNGLSRDKKHKSSRTKIVNHQ
jgi:hypothetical protein